MKGGTLNLFGRLVGAVFLAVVFANTGFAQCGGFSDPCPPVNTGGDSTTTTMVDNSGGGQANEAIDLTNYVSTSFNLRAEAGSEQIIVRWNRPDDFADLVTRYDYTVHWRERRQGRSGDDNATTMTASVISQAEDLSHIIPDLTNARRYDVWVTALSDTRLGLMSPTVAAVPVSDPDDPYAEDPHELVPFLHSQKTLPTFSGELIGVYLCDVGRSSTLDMDAVIARLEVTVPYFEWLSGGTYTPVFVPGGKVEGAPATPSNSRLSRVNIGGCPIAVREELRTMAEGGETRAFNAVMIVALADDDPQTSRSYELQQGFASITNLLNESHYPENLRDIYVTTEALNDAPQILAHEMGHSLKWRHSYSEEGGFSSFLDEYDNPMDIISGALDQTDVELFAGTLAINRYSIGWIAPDKVASYDLSSGTSASYMLRAAGADPGAGEYEMLVIPGNSKGHYYTLGARFAGSTGYDSQLPKFGVEMYQVRFAEHEEEIALTLPLVSAIVNQVTGEGSTTTHVFDVGESYTLDSKKVRIDVTGGSDGVYTVEVTPVAGVPSAPKDIAVVRTTGQVTLSWTPPDRDGGSAITGYKVHLRYFGFFDDTTRRVVVTEDLDADAREHTFDVSAFPEYQEDYLNFITRVYGAPEVWVTAVNASGEDNASVEGVESQHRSGLLLFDLPRLVIVSYHFIGPNSVRVDWDRVDLGPNLFGEYLSGITVRWTPLPGTGGQAGSQTQVLGTGSPYDTSHVTRMTIFPQGALNYEYRAEFTRYFDGGTDTLPQVFRFRMPAPPRNPALSPGNKIITVNWAPPANTYGLPIPNYVVYWRVADSGVDPSSVTATGTQHTISGLQNGMEYEVWVTADSALGQSDESGRLRATATNVPNPPFNVRAASGNTEISVSWEISQDQEEIVTGYTVHWQERFPGRGGDNSGDVMMAQVSPGTSRAYDITGLTNDAYYDVWVTARRAAENSEPSDKTQATPVSGPDNYRTEDTHELITFFNIQKTFPTFSGERIGVYLCDVGLGSTHTMETVISRLTEVAVPYFNWLSGGAYTPVFVPGGEVRGTAATPSDSPLSAVNIGECPIAVRERLRNPAEGETPDTFNAVMIVALADDDPQTNDSYELQEGFAAVASLLREPHYPGNLREIYITTQALNSRPQVLVHEMGHSLKWPHSYSDDGRFLFSQEYDNPMDMMSGANDQGMNINSFPGTVAINRYSVGWIALDKVAIHDLSGGSASYILKAAGADPEEDEYEMLVIPGYSEGHYYTLGARSTDTAETNYDSDIPKSGVEMYEVEFVVSERQLTLVSPDTRPRVRQISGQSATTAHVFADGEGYTLEGKKVRIDVSGGIGGVYTVMVTPEPGVPSAPQNTTVVRTQEAITLQWEPPTDNGGSSITAYNVHLRYYNDELARNVTHVATVSEATTEYTFNLREMIPEYEMDYIKFVTRLYTRIPRVWVTAVNDNGGESARSTRRIAELFHDLEQLVTTSYQFTGSDSVRVEWKETAIGIFAEYLSRITMHWRRLDTGEVFSQSLMLGTGSPYDTSHSTIMEITTEEDPSEYEYYTSFTRYYDGVVYTSPPVRVVGENDFFTRNRLAYNQPAGTYTGIQFAHESLTVNLTGASANLFQMGSDGRVVTAVPFTRQGILALPPFPEKSALLDQELASFPVEVKVRAGVSILLGISIDMALFHPLVGDDITFVTCVPFGQEVLAIPETFPAGDHLGCLAFDDGSSQHRLLADSIRLSGDSLFSLILSDEGSGQQSAALTLNRLLDYESATTHQFTIEVFLRGQNTVRKDFEIQVSDVDEPPPSLMLVDVDPAPNVVADNANTGAGTGLRVSLVGFEDNAVSYMITSTDGGDSTFQIDGQGNVMVAQTQAVGNDDEHTVQITATAGDRSIVRDFPVLVISTVNSDFRIISGGSRPLISRKMDEGVYINTLIVDLDVAGGDSEDTVIYSILSVSPEQPSGGNGFTINNNGEVRLTGNLDFETAGGYSLDVQAVGDPSGYAANRFIVVQVQDVPEPPTAAFNVEIGASYANGRCVLAPTDVLNTPVNHAVLLDAGASNDSDSGDALLTYSWHVAPLEIVQQPAPPQGNDALYCFTPTPGISEYTITLDVREFGTAFLTSTTTEVTVPSVFVSPVPPVLRAVITDAGDRRLIPFQTVILDGGDSEGDVTGYVWSVSPEGDGNLLSSPMNFPAVRFTAPELETVVSNPGESELRERTTYTVMLEVENAASGTTSTEVELTVLPVRIQSIGIEGTGTTAVSVLESTPPNQGFGFRVQAQRVDGQVFMSLSGLGYTVRYSLLPENVPFAITADGVVRPSESLNFSGAPTLDVTVLARVEPRSGGEFPGSTLRQMFTLIAVVLELVDTDASQNRVSETTPGARVRGVTLSLERGEEIPTDIVYSLTADSNGSFAIDSQTGVITAAGSLDHEAVPTHQITVAAQGQLGEVTVQASLTLTIGVEGLIDVGDDITLVTCEPFGQEVLAVSEIFPPGDRLGCLAFDDDSSQNQLVANSIRLSGDSLFSLIISDEGSGYQSAALTLNRPLDYESATNHQFTIDAFLRGQNTVRKDFEIQVSDADEPLQMLMDVNPALNAVADSAVEGADTGLQVETIDPENDTVSYMITDTIGGDSTFRIDGQGNVMVMQTQPVAIDDEHTLRITATAGGQSITRDFLVLVVSTSNSDFRIINRDPFLNTSSSVDEGTHDNTLIVDLDVAGIGGGPGDTVIYEITGVHPQQPSGGNGFTINSDNGEVRLSGDLDHETTPSYVVMAQAITSEVGGNSAGISILVDVQNVPEPPTAAFSVEIRESYANGQCVLEQTGVFNTLVNHAVLLDAGASSNPDSGTLSYSWHVVPLEIVQQPVPVQGNDALYCFTPTPDVSEYTVTLDVRGVGTAFLSSTTIEVIVPSAFVPPVPPVLRAVITDVEDRRLIPFQELTLDGGGSENATGYAWSVIPTGGGNLLSSPMNLSTVTFTAPESETVVSGQGASELRDRAVYTVTLEVDAESETTSTEVELTVLPVRIESIGSEGTGITEVSVLESSAPNQNFGFQVQAQRVDGQVSTSLSSLGYTVRYSLLPANVPFAITDGIVQLTEELNFTGEQTWTVMILARVESRPEVEFPGSTLRQTFTLTGTSDRVAVVLMDSDSATNEVPDRLQDPSVNGVTLAVTVDGNAVSLPDNTVTFSLSSNLGNRFEIDSRTGAVRLAPTIGPGNYQVTVNVAVQQGGETGSATLALTVRVLAPVVLELVDTNANQNRVQEVIPGAPVTGVTLSLKRGAAIPTNIAYSLTVNPGGLFEIDSQTGAITAAGSLDYETARTHQITVTAQGQLGEETMPSSRPLTIDVEDLWEFVIPTDQGQDPYVTEGVAGAPVMNLPTHLTFGGTCAVMNYFGFNVGTGYRDGGGDPNDRFEPAEASGNRSFRLKSGISLDYENEAERGPHVVYLNVRAASGCDANIFRSFNRSIFPPMLIHVRNVNEGPGEITDIDDRSNQIAHTMTSGVPVRIQAQAVDPESDAVTYSLPSNAGGKFQIDSGTGIIRTLALGDPPLQDTEYTVTVVAASSSDEGVPGTATADFMITVLVDEPYPGSIAEVRVTGGPEGGDVAFMIVLDEPVPPDETQATIAYQIEPGVSNPLSVADDLGAVTGQATIATGEIATTVRVAVSSDDRIEHPESGTLTIQNVAFTVDASETFQPNAPNRVTPFTIEDRTVMAVTVAAGGIVAEGFEGAAGMIPVTVSVANETDLFLDRNVVVGLSFSGIARPNTDYVPLNPESVIFLDTGPLQSKAEHDVPGSALSGMVAVTLIPDTMENGFKTLTVSIASNQQDRAVEVGTGVGRSGSATSTIGDNGLRVSVAAGTGAITESDDLVFRVTLTGGAVHPELEVGYRITGVIASDVISEHAGRLADSVTFAAGTGGGSEEVRLTTRVDGDVEGTETATITITTGDLSPGLLLDSANSSAGIDVGDGDSPQAQAAGATGEVITANLDEANPSTGGVTLVLSRELMEDESVSATYTLTVGGGPGATAADVNEITASPQTATTTQRTRGAGSVFIPVTAFDDGFDDDGETVEVQITQLVFTNSAGTVSDIISDLPGNVRTVVLAITDNDESVAVTVTPPATVEQGGTASINVATDSLAAGQTVTVRLSVLSGVGLTLDSSQDVNLPFSLGTQSQDVTIAAGDGATLGQQNVTVAVVDPVNVTVMATTQVSVLVVFEPIPLNNTVLSENPAEADPSVGGVTLTLSRDLKTGESVTVAYTLTAGSGAMADDIAGVSSFPHMGTVTLNTPSEDTIRIPVTASEDSANDDGETVSVEITGVTFTDTGGGSNPLGLTELTPHLVTLTIQDNDDAVVLPVEVVDANGLNNAADDVFGSVAENEPINTTVGITVEARRGGNPVSGTQFVLTAGGNDFQIDATTGVVRTARGLNYEALSPPHQITITVRATPPGETAIEASFIIAVTNAGEMLGPSEDINGGTGNNRVNENMGNALIGITIQAIDPDGNFDPVSYRVIGNNAEFFTINSETGVARTAPGAGLDAETQPMLSITIEARSNFGLLGGNDVRNIQYTVTVIDVNEPPTVAIVPGSGVETDSDDGAFLATTDEAIQLDAVVVDQDVGDSHSHIWSLVSGDGSSVTFGQPGNSTTLFTATQAGDYPVRLMVTDNDGLSASATVTVRVEVAPPALEDEVATESPDEGNSSAGGVTLTLSRVLNQGESVLVDYTLTVVGGTTATDINEVSAFPHMDTITLTTQNANTIRIPVTAFNDDDDDDNEMVSVLVTTVTFTAANGNEVILDRSILSPNPALLTISDNDPVAVGDEDPAHGSGTTGVVGSVVENAPADTTVGITVIVRREGTQLPVMQFDLTGAGFKIDTNGVMATTGPLDYETATEHTITVTAMLQEGGSAQGDFRIAVTNVADQELEPITDENAAANQVDENAGDAEVGITAQALDADGPLDSVSYSLADDAGGRFVIDQNGVVKTAPGPGLDAEDPQGMTWDITVRATSNHPSDTEDRVFTVTVNDVNEVPTAVAITSVASTAVDGAFLVTAGETIQLNSTVTDPDAGDTLGYSWVSTPSAGVTFGQSTSFSTAFTATQARDYLVGLTVTDSGGLSVASTVTVRVEAVVPVVIVDVNTLNNSVAENVTESTEVGITAAARRGENVLEVTGFALPGNSDFQIDTNGVVTTTGPLDYETATEHTITVMATLGEGDTAQGDFTIAVTNVADQPLQAITDESAAANQVNENAGDAEVGITAQALDADGPLDSVSYSLADDAGGRFVIDQNGVVKTAPGPGLDAEVQASWQITVEATSDFPPATQSLNFTVAVIDVNEAPTAVAIMSVASTAVDGAFLVTAGETIQLNSAVTDPDAGDTFSYNWVSTPPENVTFGQPTSSNTGFTATQARDYLVELTVTDSGGETVVETVTVRVEAVVLVAGVVDANSLNDAADGVFGSVAENVTAPTEVGITAVARRGEDVLEVTEFVLTGSSDFQIDGSGVVTTTGPLDHETAISHTVTVTATLGEGGTTEGRFIIEVTNVNEKPTGEIVAGSGVGVDSGTGAFLAVTGEAIELVARVTDPDIGDTHIYSWFPVISPGPSTLLPANAATTRFSATQVGVYRIALLVTDADGLTDLDTADINVRAPAVYPTEVSAVRVMVGVVPEGGTVEIVIELNAPVPDGETATIPYSIAGDDSEIPQGGSGVFDVFSRDNDLGELPAATITGGQTLTTVRVPVVADSRIENSESGEFIIFYDDNVTFDDANQNFQVGEDASDNVSIFFGLLDRTAMAVTIAAGGAAEGFAGAAGTIPVTVSVANAQALHLDRNVDVMLSFADGSAQSGVDYTPPGPAVVTFTNSLPGQEALPEHNPGAGTVLSVETTVALIPDALGEGDETFTVSIPESQQDTAVERAATTHTATATIEDSNRLSVSLSGPVGSVAEDAGSVEVAVLVNSASNSQVTLVNSVTVSVATENEVAMAGEDYTALNETVTIQPGPYPSIGSAGNRIAVEIGILDDTIVEPDGKSFRVVLTTSDGRVTLGTAEATVTIDDNDVTAVLNPVGADALSVSAGETTMLTVTTDPVLEPGETAMLTLTPGGVAGVSLNPVQVPLDGATAQTATTQVTVIAGLQAAQLAEDVTGTVTVSAAVGPGVHVNFGESLPLRVVPLQVEVMFDETGIELIAGEVRTIGFEVLPADRGTPISVVFVEDEAGADITVASPVTVDDGTTAGDVSVTVGMGASPGLTADVTVDTQGTDAGRAQVFATNSLRVTVVRAVDAVLEPAGPLNLSAGRSMMLTVRTEPELRTGESAMLTLSVGGVAGVRLSSTQVVLNGGSAETRSTQVELIAASGAAGASGEVSVAVEADSDVRVTAPANRPFNVTQLQLRVAFDTPEITLATEPGTVKVRVQPVLMGTEMITVDFGMERETGSIGMITVSPPQVILNVSQSELDVMIAMTGFNVGEAATVTLTIDAVGTDVGNAQALASGDLRVEIVGRSVSAVFLDDASLVPITALMLAADGPTTVRVSTTPTLGLNESVTLDIEVPGDIGLSAEPAFVSLSSGTTNAQVELRAERLAGGTGDVKAETRSRSAMGVAVLDGSLGVTVNPMTFRVTLAGTGGDLVSGRSTMTRLSVSPELIGEETITVNFVVTEEIEAIDPVTLDVAGRSSATITVTADDGIAADAAFTVTPEIDSDQSNIGNAAVTATGSLQGTARRLFIVSFAQETLMLTSRQASSPVAVGTGGSPLLLSGEEITVTLTSSGVPVTVTGSPVTLMRDAQSATITIEVPSNHENEGNAGEVTLSVESTGVNHVFVESDNQPLQVFFEPSRGIMLRLRVFLEGALQ